MQYDGLYRSLCQHKQQAKEKVQFQLKLQKRYGVREQPSSLSCICGKLPQELHTEKRYTTRWNDTQFFNYTASSSLFNNCDQLISHVTGLHQFIYLGTLMNYNVCELNGNKYSSCYWNYNVCIVRYIGIPGYGRLQMAQWYCLHYTLYTLQWPIAFI